MIRAGRLLTLLIGGLAVAAVTQAAEAPPEAASVVERFHAALAAGDRAQVLAVLDSSVVIFESGGAELSRDEYASHHLAGDMEYVAATKTEVTDRRGGGSGDVAWVLSRSKTTGKFRGKEVSSSGTESMVLERGADGAWRIVHIHWSSRPLDPVDRRP